MTRLQDATAALGRIDVYLLDQVMRGHIRPEHTILDAGCGSGRNLEPFMRSGFDVSALDPAPDAVAQTRMLARSAGIDDGEERFRVEPLESASFADGTFDVVICNAVLHFARDAAHFDAMTMRVRDLLKPGGLCFARLATSIGIEDRLRPCADRPPGWHDLPDGSARFLVDLDRLLKLTGTLGVDLVDPIKTVNVQNLRCMSNWVWRR